MGSSTDIQNPHQNSYRFMSRTILSGDRTSYAGLMLNQRNSTFAPSFGLCSTAANCSSGLVGALMPCPARPRKQINICDHRIRHVSTICCPASTTTVTSVSFFSDRQHLWISSTYRLWSRYSSSLSSAGNCSSPVSNALVTHLALLFNSL